MRSVIIDKLDSTFDIKISSDIGMRLPLLAEAGGKALLSQLPNSEIGIIYVAQDLTPSTPHTRIDKEQYKKMLKKVREEGIALEREKYIEGIFAFAVPVSGPINNLQPSLWAVGLKSLVPEQVIPKYSTFLKQIADKIESRFFVG